MRVQWGGTTVEARSRQERAMAGAIQRLRRGLTSLLVLGALIAAMLAIPAASQAFTGHHCSKSTCRYFTSSYQTAKYYYDRRTCDQWKGLSNQYLHGFNSEKRLKRTFNRKKHSPC